MDRESLDDFLVENANNKRTGKAVYLWWERQRLKYNAICFAIGMMSVFGIQTVMKLPSIDFGLYAGAIIIVALLGNLFYFSGWFIELFTNRNEKVGPTLFFLGTLFSAIVLVVPFFIVLIFFAR